MSEKNQVPENQYQLFHETDGVAKKENHGSWVSCTIVTRGPSGEDPSIEFTFAATPEGHYIGDERFARFLEKRGIMPELAEPDDKVCSIGFCEKEQKWYGWSHRALCGFGIGDVVKEGDLTATSGYDDEYIKEHPELDKSLPVGFVARTLDDAKKMAVAFADAVS